MATTVYVEDEDDVFDYELDWVECIENTQPGGGGHSSRTTQEETLVGYIPFNKSRSAEAYFLGYSTCADSEPFFLSRNLPQRHPTRPTLYAYAYSCVAIGPKPLSVEDGGDGSTNLVSPFESTDPNSDMAYANYQLGVVTVRYRSFGRTLFLPDDEINGYADEFRRYGSFVGQPAVQALSADGTSQLKWAETSTGGPPLGESIPTPIPTLLAKANVTFNWMEVPHEYLTNSKYILNATKIIDRLGTVNEDIMFDEFLEGTMLFTAVEFDAILFPLTPVDLDSPITGWNIKFHFENFDPQDKGVPDSPYRGHRLFPYRINGLWYYCTRSDSTKELLPLSTMMKIFSHINDNS